jgi:hypothetical protein
MEPKFYGALIVRHRNASPHINGEGGVAATRFGIDLHNIAHPNLNPARGAEDRPHKGSDAQEDDEEDGKSDD